MLTKRGWLYLIIITFNNEITGLPLILNDSLSLLSVHVLRASFESRVAHHLPGVLYVSIRSLAINRK